jgi:NADPH2:quinone reductase
MRAMVVDTPGPVEALRLKQTAEPRPGPGELTIDVEYAGVGLVDALFRSGAIDLPTPFTPGIEAAGHVREVGPDVEGFEPGQAVGALLNDFGRGMRAGGYAEVAVAHATMATLLPDGADLPRIAGALINGVTAWIALHALARLDVRDDVLVLGASGGLGSITGRVAAIHPARRVIGVVGTAARRPADTAAWTDVVVAADLDKAIDELTGGRGVDVVIDPVGGELRTGAYERLAPFGRLVVLGNASGDDRPISGDSAWFGSRQVLGLNLGGTAHLMPRRVGDALSAVVDLVHRGVLREPAPAIVPFDQAAEVHQALETRTAPAKTVLALRT